MIILYNILEVLVVLVPILMTVAFVTIAERKIMAAMQRRCGPNAVGVWGIMQPFADALKLLVKEIIIPRQSNSLLFVIGPCITLIFALLGWAIIPFGEGLAIFDYELGVFFALAVSSIGSYGILISGWAANSKYAFMGAIRSTAQLLSYELVFSSIILILILFSGSFSLTYIVECQQAVWNIFPLMPIALMFFIAILAETNRPPFDLPEARFGQLKKFVDWNFFSLKFIKCWKPFYLNNYFKDRIILREVINKIFWWQLIHYTDQLKNLKRLDMNIVNYIIINLINKWLNKYTLLMIKSFFSIKTLFNVKNDLNHINKLLNNCLNPSVKSITPNNIYDNLNKILTINQIL